MTHCFYYNNLHYFHHTNKPYKWLRIPSLTTLKSNSKFLQWDKDFFNLSLAGSSTKFPSTSNFSGGWNALRVNSGLLIKWRSRNTPIWRRWYWDTPPPNIPPVLMMAAGLSAQTLGGREAQSIAFLRGAVIVFE